MITPGSARADRAGDEVLKKMDTAQTRAKDQMFVYDLTTKEPGKSPRALQLKVTIKGESWRRVDFLGPGDVKGMKVLILSMSQMYVWLPAYRKIRRVASHVRDQGFMGTTFNHDDMSITRYSSIFSAKLVSETKEHWKVKATRRPGKDYPYKTLLFTIAKKYRQATEIRYYNDKGAHVKTEVRKGYTCKGEICNADTMKLTDHTRNDTWSEFKKKKWEVNTGVADRFFTVRSLQRGR